MHCFTLPLVLATTLVAGPVEQRSRLVETRELDGGSASQGLALSEDYYYGSTSKTICRFDTNWKFVNKRTIVVDGVNHVGAIHYHAGFLWAGLLHGPVGGKHDSRLDGSIIAKIRSSDLEIVETWNISRDITWVDPVYFDGGHLWVGDLLLQLGDRVRVVSAEAPVALCEFVVQRCGVPGVSAAETTSASWSHWTMSCWWTRPPAEHCTLAAPRGPNLFAPSSRHAHNGVPE